MLSNSRTAYQSHNHQKCVDAALAQARTLCESRGARLTPIRESVLRLVWQSHRPMGAYNIAEQLPGVLGRRILAPTVYRSIDFLLALGLIHRITTLNAYIGCPFAGSEHSDLFLICENCGSAAEFSAEMVQSSIDAAADRAHFKVSSQQLEILGLCPNCQAG